MDFTKIRDYLKYQYFCRFKTKKKIVAKLKLTCLKTAGKQYIAVRLATVNGKLIVIGEVIGNSDSILQQ